MEKEETRDEYAEAVHKFYEIYSPLQKRHNLRLHSHFDIYGNNFIEIFQYDGEKRGKCVCKVKEDEAIDCYRRAAKQLTGHGEGF